MAQELEQERIEPGQHDERPPEAADQLSDAELDDVSGGGINRFGGD